VQRFFCIHNGANHVRAVIAAQAQGTSGVCTDTERSAADGAFKQLQICSASALNALKDSVVEGMGSGMTTQPPPSGEFCACIHGIDRTSTACSSPIVAVLDKIALACSRLQQQPPSPSLLPPHCTEADVQFIIQYYHRLNVCTVFAFDEFRALLNGGAVTGQEIDDNLCRCVREIDTSGTGCDGLNVVEAIARVVAACELLQDDPVSNTL
jgi:hypothetical protein